MIVQQCNGVIQVVLDTVNSVQLKLKKLPIMMTDETRERQLLQPSSDQQDQQDQKIDPFSNEILLTISDWIILTLGTIFLLPLRTIGVVLVFCLAYVVAKIGLIGLTAEEIASNVGRQGWRRKLMSWYASFGILIFWAAGFRVKVKGRQVSREEAPILVAAPHSSFMEGLIIYMCGSSPVSRHENQTAFLISACQLFYQAIFVDRRTNETRKKAMEMICERARSPDNNLPQLFLCPEGTNTNRKVLIQFKVGAFAPGVPVQPVLIRYPGTERVDPITWTYNQSHSYKFSVWYLLANPINRVEVEFLPVYTPNVEEVSKAEVYAKNVQKLMAEALEIQATEISCGAFYKEYCKQQNTYIQEDSEKTNDIKKTN